MAITKSVQPGLHSVPVAAATKISAGDLVGVNASGFGAPAAQDSVRIVGVARYDADNASGSDGEIRVELERGCFVAGNDETTPVTEGTEFAKVVSSDTVAAWAAGDTEAQIRVYGLNSEGLPIIDLR